MAATDAVSQWRYRPTLLNGEPIEVLTTITIDFKLQANTALDLNRSIKSAEFEVARLRETYTEAHPDVRRAEARLEQLRKLQTESQPQPAR
jgi:hypothetical protein